MLGSLAEPLAAERSAPSKAKRTETGLASYYSRRFDGKQTASGETFSNRSSPPRIRRIR